MKKVVFLAMAVVFVASMAFAQAGSVGVFADPMGLNCNLVDQAPMGLKQYMVVHVYTTGATAVQYRAKVPVCMTATGAMWLSDTNMFAVAVGNSQIGIGIAYGSCKVGPIHTQIINVFAMGTTPACCRWIVDADPNVTSGKIEGSDCAFVVFNPTGGQAFINPNLTCQCNVPAQDTTWGQVKSLYVE